MFVLHDVKRRVMTWLCDVSAIMYPMVNSFIHIVMYTYYGMAAMGPHMQKYLWWKRYLTMLQIVSDLPVFLLYGGQYGLFHLTETYVLFQCKHTNKLTSELTYKGKQTITSMNKTNTQKSAKKTVEVR